MRGGGTVEHIAACNRRISETRWTASKRHGFGYFCDWDRNAIARRTAGGSVASFPITECHKISFSSKSSILSYSLKSIFADRSAPYAQRSFLVLRSISAGRRRYGVTSTESEKDLNIGRAAASY